MLPQPQMILFCRNGAAVSVDSFFLSLEAGSRQVCRVERDIAISVSALRPVSHNGNVQMLYEPEASRQAVSAVRRIPCVAACSPDTQRYKEFCKQYDAKQLYVSCPTHNKRLTMGSSLVSLAECSHFTPTEILKRKSSLRFVFTSSLDFEQYSKNIQDKVSNMEKSEVFKSSNKAPPRDSLTRGSFDAHARLSSNSRCRRGRLFQL
mmetsp:Transcript_10298/g.16862  ORF Transcript_10298/g.16862 Transcript_10298/m.16862 type:complete len:206 (+) Transcript_10298:927-1544(+)